MKKLKEHIRKFLSERYGVDNFNRALTYTAIILSILGLIFRAPKTRAIINTIIIIILTYTLFRMLSKDFTSRYQENIQFMKLVKPVRAKFEILALKWRDRKSYRYIRCDKCKTYMRVPKNVGKIKVKCKNCGNEFIVRV